MRFEDFEVFEDVRQDCRIVGPAAENLFTMPGFAHALSARFRQDARGDVTDQVPADASDRVRLVVVDSVQDDPNPGAGECPADPGVGALECSPHGAVLVGLAKDLLCAGGSCAAKVTTRRVLRWTHRIKAAGSSPTAVELELEDPVGEIQGGFSGTLEDLAQAIRRPVEAWWNEGEDRPRLILNLSVGWEPINAADSPMVRAALQDAVCRGALVIAAAGNRVAGPASLATPLLPAAWEQEPAPSLQECEALLEAPAQPAPEPLTTTYKPLLYAVGGVQQDGRLLSNSRPNATPRLVAFGDHAPGPPPGYETLTGTSVSTLVVSAAAARRWGENPDPVAFDLMETLWDESKENEVAQLVDFCLDPEANCRTPENERARRVFVHHKPAAPEPWPGGAPTFDDSAITQVLLLADLTAQVSLPSCDPQLLAVKPPPPAAELCPQRLFDIAVQPWLGSQPGANHNPDCTYTQASPGTILLEFDSRFRVGGLPVTLSDFTLLVAGKAYRLSDAEFTLGKQGAEPHQIVLTGLDFEQPPHPMYLAVTVNGEHATLTPILQLLASD